MSEISTYQNIFCLITGFIRSLVSSYVVWLSMWRGNKNNFKKTYPSPLQKQQKTAPPKNKQNKNNRSHTKSSHPVESTCQRTNAYTWWPPHFSSGERYSISVAYKQLTLSDRSTTFSYPVRRLLAYMSSETEHMSSPSKSPPPPSPTEA